MSARNPEQRASRRTRAVSLGSRARRPRAADGNSPWRTTCFASFTTRRSGCESGRQGSRVQRAFARSSISTGDVSLFTYGFVTYKLSADDFDIISPFGNVLLFMLEQKYGYI